MTPAPILSVIVNVHREGDWAHKAIRSAAVALERLCKARPDDGVELIVVCDKVDDETFRCVGEALTFANGLLVARRAWFERVQVELGDLGLSRNAGISYAKGRFVAFLDGDDVWGEDWALLGVEALEFTAREAGHELVAAHPCTNVDFGDGAFWWTQPDQRDDDFDPATFWTTNCWSSGVMASRELLTVQPYLPRTDGLGFEDWEWNARTFSYGAIHVSVPGAVVFIRKKRDGLNAQSAAKKQVVAHSPYFERDPDTIDRQKHVPILPTPSGNDWLFRQWKAAHPIEPALWPDARLVQSLPRYKATPTRLVPKIAQLFESKVDYRPTHIVVAPCLVRGGADRRVLEYARAAARAGGKPLVILTDRVSDQDFVGEQIDRRVHVIDAAEVFAVSGDDAAVFGLVRMLMRWASGGDGPILHLVNSRIGYMAVANFGAALRDSRVGPIYCSLYGSEERNGRLGGAAFNGWFDNAKKHIDLVLTDNLAHMRQLAKVYAWPSARRFLVPSIVNAPTTVLRPKPMQAIRVLWASRIVAGKRLDRLAAAAKLAHESKLPFLFSVAGAPGDTFSKFTLDALRALPNVKLSPRAFAGWGELSADKHDVFMFTSETEGMPNVVLEALAHGLPVASTDVGDVATLPKESVRIVTEPDDPRVWLEALARVAREGKPAHGYLSNNHSVESFDVALGVAGYLNGVVNDGDQNAANG